MVKYFKILKNISKNNKKLYNLKTESILQVLFSKISYLFSPFLIILNITPNTITFLNFIISLFSIIFIFYGSEYFFELGIILYIFYRVFDFCDGAVARYLNTSTFYGRFIDGLADIFLNTFLILSVSFYSFKILNSVPLLLFGCISSVLTAFDTFIYDRYSALARWSNFENRTKITPFIKTKFMQKSKKFYIDIITVLLIIMPFIEARDEAFYINIFLFFLIFTVSAVQNILLHISFASVHFKLKAKVKTKQKTPK